MIFYDSQLLSHLGPRFTHKDTRSHEMNCGCLVNKNTNTYPTSPEKV